MVQFFRNNSFLNSASNLSAGATSSAALEAAPLLASLSEQLATLSVEQLTSANAQSELENLARGVDLVSRLQQVQHTIAHLKSLSPEVSLLSSPHLRSRVDQWEAAKKEMRHLEIAVRSFALPKVSPLPKLVTSVLMLREELETAAAVALRALQNQQEEIELSASAMRAQKLRPLGMGTAEFGEGGDQDADSAAANEPTAKSKYAKSNADKAKKKNERTERLEKRASLLKELQEQMQQAKSAPASGGSLEVAFASVAARACVHARGSVRWACEVVGIAPTESLDTARTRFRERARQWHPDVRSHTPEEDEAMVWLNEAWEILKRSQK